MSRRDDGGTAFPVSIPGCGDNGQQGMSLRDWFAGQALAGLCTALISHTRDEREGIVERAYAMADAMLSEREVEP